MRLQAAERFARGGEISEIAHDLRVTEGPGPAVAPLSGVVMPSVSAVSVMPGLDDAPPDELLLLLPRPPQPASISASAEAPATTRNAVRDRE